MGVDGATELEDSRRIEENFIENGGKNGKGRETRREDNAQLFLYYSSSSCCSGRLLGGSDHAKCTKMALRLVTGMMVFASMLMLMFFLLGPSNAMSYEGMSESTTANKEKNLRPIIGILAQELSKSMGNAVNGTYSSYIAASYVKFCEGAGARVVPIFINQDDDYYKKIVSSVNGVLFPGGSVSITETSGYGRAGKKLYDLILEKNQPLPLFTVCLGFEMLMHLAANERNPLTSCSARNRADPLILSTEYEKGELFEKIPIKVTETLTKSNATSNFHKYCVLPETFVSMSLDRDYYLLSTSFDDDKVEYVSTVEHKTKPIYGLQWHPEKNIYEWTYDSIPHTSEAVQAAQYFANFFVDKARLNSQTYASDEDERNSLIYNYSPTFSSSLYKSSFEQVYLFK